VIQQHYVKLALGRLSGSKMGTEYRLAEEGGGEKRKIYGRRRMAGDMEMWKKWGA